MADLTLDEIKAALGNAYGVGDIAEKPNPLSTYVPGTEIAPHELNLSDFENAITQAFSPEAAPQQTGGVLPSFLKTGAETGLGIASGIATPVAGGLYGLVRSIPEAIQTGQAPAPIAQKYAEQFIQQHPGFKVTDPQAQSYLESLQKMFEASKLPPVMPEGLQMSKGGATPKEILLATKANMPKIRLQKSPVEMQMADQFAQRGQNIGAAQATPATVLQGNIDAAIANASPELQTHIKSVPPESVNLPALETRSLEEKHGVNLTTGQRTGDTQLYSQEWNKRGETPTLGSHFEAQPQQISSAFEATKQRHAPDISSTADASELGQYQINALAAKDASRQQAITSAYQKLTDANGGQFPIDVSALQGNITSQLSKNLKTNHLPESINSDMRDFYKNPTFEAYEALRTNLANEMRSNSNGNARAAAYIVRDELEKLPVFGEGTGNPQAIQLKQLADDARSLVKERYSVLNNNPAYKAAVKEFGSLNDAASQGESLNAANFHKKFVANGTPESIRRMKSEIPADDIANQAITFAELERAKNAAVNASERNLTPEQFAKFLKTNKSGLMEALPPQAMQDITELGFLTSKIGMPKTGTFNYSNTFSSQLGEMARQGLLTAAEAKLAGATGGASIPAIGLTKQFMQKLNKEGFAKQATNPVGGLTKD